VPSFSGKEIIPHGFRKKAAIQEMVDTIPLVLDYAHMDQRPDLLIFSKKEFFAIVILLVLVALFSFTLGLKMGKTLGFSSKDVAQSEPQTPVKVEQPATVTESATTTEVATQTETAPAQAPQPEVKKADEAEVAPDAAQGLSAEEYAGEQLHKDKKTKAQPGAGGKYTLQVGSYRTVSEAAERVADLKHSGLDAFYLAAEVPGKGTWYRVGIGVFRTKSEAERTAAEWKKTRQVPPFIVQKVTD
jgi:type IV secretory pathway VirB10-like protein